MTSLFGKQTHQKLNLDIQKEFSVLYDESISVLGNEWLSLTICVILHWTVEIAFRNQTIIER